MKKTLEEMLKSPHNIGVTDIAEYVCTGYDKDIFSVIRLLDAYTLSLDREHKRAISDGGRDMMRTIISMLEGKVDSSKHNTDKCLTKDLDHHIGRTSAFKEILEIMKRYLNMLEHKEPLQSNTHKKE